MITVETDRHGVRTLLWDSPATAHNLLSTAVLSEFAAIVQESLAAAEVCGLVICSLKSSFVVGADLDELMALAGAEQALGFASAMQNVLRTLERGGKPVVAALNGSALGGGLELALACHHRIAADVDAARFGFPEVALGLLPGGGGTQRLPRLIGVAQSVPYLLQGLRVGPKQALDAGLVDEIVPPGELLEHAKSWVREHPQVSQPWDQPDFRPSIDARTSQGAAFFLQETAKLRAATWLDDPARQAILRCVYESAASPIDVGLRAERRHFAGLLSSTRTRDLIRTTFMHARRARRQGRAEQMQPGSTAAVVGAGMMGAGIALVCARAGYQVTLIDQSMAAAQRGCEFAAKALARGVAAGECSESEAERVLERIHPAAELAAAADASFAIEAVFEDRTAKAAVYSAVEQCTRSELLLATNTSTLPIASLSGTLQRPENFVGLHFFSPVDRMALVEVICGPDTSADTLARALALVRSIGKTSIVVKDQRGFFTSRVFSSYVHEGLALLAEGVTPALIENAGRLAGMPVGPLAVVDELSAVLLRQIQLQTARDLGSAYEPAAGDAVLAMLVDELDRPGRKYGRGLYDYPSSGPKHLWPGLARHFSRAQRAISTDTVRERLLYIQAIEAARCLEQGVVSSPADADLGSVLGWSFPAGLGGVLAFVDRIGCCRFVQRCDELAVTAGQRFAPPELLRRMAASDGRFYPAGQVRYG